MSNVSEPLTQADILSSFKAIVRAHVHSAENTLTREERARLAEDMELVQRLSGTTVTGIVKDMAELQLQLSERLVSLRARMETEVGRLDELRRALRIERARVQRLERIQVAAEALVLLEREQLATRESFADKAQQDINSLNDEQQETRIAWADEQAQHLESIQEKDARLADTRTREEDEHSYSTGLSRRKAEDKLAEKKAAMERSLQLEGVGKEADFTAREAALEAQSAHIAALEARVQSFPGELDEAVKAARSKAIKVATEEARVDAELAKKGFEATLSVQQLRAQSLEATLLRQREQLEALTAQLAQATSSAQDLAVRAVSGS